MADPVVNLEWPPIAKNRGPWFWARPANLIASRRTLRPDHSNTWRYAHEAANPPSQSRSASFDDVVPGLPRAFRIVILGDTGEGDRSQYSLLPLLHAVDPDFMIINGDVAYPSGELNDFAEGFFRPYQGLGVPVWATAGNHEYYSANSGKNFYDVFCGRALGSQWSAHGLRLVPQPGMYWELRDPAGRTPLVLLGLDTGQSANLDGHNSFLAKLLGKQGPDTGQHQWLEWRLSVADQNQSRVVVLFHIPGLVQGAHDKSTHLGELHRIIARHPSVRAVFCGHIHNHQQYAAATFRQYSAKQHGAPAGAGPAPPEYIVSGNGGAALEATDFAGEYETADRYPSVAQWKDYTSRVRRGVEAFWPGSLLARVVAQAESGKKPDNDPWGLQSFLVLDVDPAAGRISVSQVFLDDLKLLFKKQGNATVRVNAPDAPLDPGALQACTKPLFNL